MPRDLRLTVDGDLSPLERKIAKITKKRHSLGQLDAKGFSAPLGKIKGQLGEFDKSLEASNARVIAFGASAGAIYAVSDALRQTVAATINVEKALVDFKNPYDTKKTAITHGGGISNDTDVGYIRMSSPQTKIKVLSCIETPCTGTQCTISNHICSHDIDLN